MPHLLTLVTAFVIFLLIATPPGQAAEARILTSEDMEVCGGSDFQGGPGDYLLANDEVWAVLLAIEDVAAPPRPLVQLFQPSRGVLTDLGTTGRRNDQLNQISQFLNLDLSLFVNYDRLVEMASSGEAAWITVAGQALQYDAYRDSRPRELRVKTSYRLRDGQPWIELETTVTNGAEVPVPVFQVSDGDLLFFKNRYPFQPFPDRGPKPPPLDLADPWPAIGAFPFVAAPGNLAPYDGPVTDQHTPAGEVGYTWIPEDGEQPLIGVASGEMLFVGNHFDVDALRRGRPPTLAPGETLTYRRKLVVSRRNTVASGLEAALPLLGERRLVRVRGRVVDPRGGGVPRTQVVFTNLEPGAFGPWVEGLGTELDNNQDGTVDACVPATGGAPLPWTQTVSGPAGGFDVLLSRGTFEGRFQAAERRLRTLRFDTRDADAVLDLGDVVLSGTGTLSFTVRDGDTGEPMPALVTVACQWGSPVPDFGDQYLTRRDYPGIQRRCGGPGAAEFSGTNLNETFKGFPAFDRAATLSGTGSVELAPGRYCATASRGLEYTLDESCFTVRDGAVTQRDFTLRRVVDTSGFVSMDFHVHAAQSFDSSVPFDDRLASFLGTGVEALVLTEHNHVATLWPEIERLGLAREIAAIVGEELSGSVPVPSSLTGGLPVFPGGIGHWNAWPLRVIRDNRRNGAPQNELIVPGTAIDRLRGMAQLPALGATPDTATLDQWLAALGHPHDEVVMLNHPRAGTILDVTVGLFNGLLNPGGASPGGYDPTKTIDACPNLFLTLPSDYNARVLGDPRGTDTTGLSFDAMELMTGITVSRYLTTRTDWFSLLDQGLNKTATAVSDSHAVALTAAGYARSYVASSADRPDALDHDELLESIKEMRLVGTTGPFLRFAVIDDDGQPVGLGGVATVTGDEVLLEIRVEAAPWVAVEQVRIFRNGCLSKVVEIDPDRFLGTVLRFAGTAVLANEGDAYFTVEAGVCLDKDGQPCHPELLEPSAKVVDDLVPLGFTNPIFVDRDGQGYEPPGLPEGKCAGRRADTEALEASSLRRVRECLAATPLPDRTGAEVDLGLEAQGLWQRYGATLGPVAVAYQDPPGLRHFEAYLPPRPKDVDPYARQERLRRHVGDGDVAWVDYDLYDGRVYRVRQRLDPSLGPPDLDAVAGRLEACLGVEPIFDQVSTTAALLWGIPAHRRIVFSLGDETLELVRQRSSRPAATDVIVTDRRRFPECAAELPVLDPPEPWWLAPLPPVCAEQDDSP